MLHPCAAQVAGASKFYGNEPRASKVDAHFSFTSRHHFALLSSPANSKLNTIICRQSDYQTPVTSFRPPFSSERAPSPPGAPAKVFVSHSVYKGKAALTVEPRAPEFVLLDSGAYKVSKEGFIYLQFAPSSGVRQYDWARKQVFSLSVPEIGTLISLGPRDSCEFFHDPNKGRSDEGKVKKVLKVEPLPDGSGLFFNLSVQNKLQNIDENIYIPITKGEFAVLGTIFSYVLPYLLGWHTFAGSIKADENVSVNSANPKFGGDFEWSR